MTNPADSRKTNGLSSGTAELGIWGTGGTRANLVIFIGGRGQSHEQGLETHLKAYKFAQDACVNHALNEKLQLLWDFVPDHYHFVSLTTSMQIYGATPETAAKT